MIVIKEERQKIFFLFLDIPFITVEKLHKKCDKFVKNHIVFDSWL